VNINPWIGVVIIALGLAGVGLFAHYHIPQVAIPVGLITLGTSILYARSQIMTTTENKQLRASLRPPPSLTDEEERKH
jgi:hypothetical protein